MKLIRHCPDILKNISAELSYPFIYIDVGCGYNGIDEPLLDFGERLLAYGFDANIDECQRLISQNQNSNIHYIPGRVKLSPSHPFSMGREGKSYWSNNPWSHLAVSRSLEKINVEALTHEEKSTYNLWPKTEFAEPPEDIYLDDYLPAQGVKNIDLCKIDVDGEDFDILHSLEPFLAHNKVLSIVVEVNYFGSDNEYDHTFHNVDRFLRKYGFDLYGLTINKYSARSLPYPYSFNSPGENVYGRPYQGDALYIINPFTKSFKPDKDNTFKLTALFALFNLPDWSAEILQTFGDDLLEPCHKNKLLNLFTNQIQMQNLKFSDYDGYINAFEENDPYFYSGHIEACPSSVLLSENERLRMELSCMKKSTSWLVTTPFRYIGDLIRSI